MLRQAPAALCASCHTDVAKRIAEGDAHAPAARGQCLTCHSSHGSERPGMTRRPGAALCTACHDPKKLAATPRHAGMDIPAANCVSCHDPHAQPKGQRGLLQSAKHMPFVRDECTACHTSRGSAKLKKSGAELCLTCHPKGGWVGRKHTHAPVSTGPQCLSCHGPHGGAGVPSLRTAGDALCFGCHERKKFQGAVVHAAMKRGCVTCHDPHGSDGPRLVKESNIADACRKCHADNSKHFHRTTSDRPAPDGQPLTCTSCHSPHAAAYPGLLNKDPKRDLCVQCHDSPMSPGEGGSHGSAPGGGGKH
jgi:predicted CXXCH cytochrome family protein